MLANDYVEIEHELSDRRGDHLAWRAQLAEALWLGQEFTGQLDASKCKLGQWLSQVDKGELFAGLPPEVKEQVRQLAESHVRLHNSAKAALAAQAAGKEEAARVYQETTLSALDDVLQEISAIQEQMHELAHEARERMLDNSRTIRMAVVGFLLGALIVGIAAALWMTRRIGVGLKQVMALLDELAEGDLRLEGSKEAGGNEGDTGDEFGLMSRAAYKVASIPLLRGDWCWIERLLSYTIL